MVSGKATAFHVAMYNYNHQLDFTIESDGANSWLWSAEMTIHRSSTPLGGFSYELEAGTSDRPWSGYSVPYPGDTTGTYWYTVAELWMRGEKTLYSCVDWCLNAEYEDQDPQQNSCFAGCACDGANNCVDHCEMEAHYFSDSDYWFEVGDTDSTWLYAGLFTVLSTNSRTYNSNYDSADTSWSEMVLDYIGWYMWTTWTSNNLWYTEDDINLMPSICIQACLYRGYCPETSMDLQYTYFEYFDFFYEAFDLEYLHEISYQYFSGANPVAGSMFGVALLLSL